MCVWKKQMQLKVAKPYETQPACEKNKTDTNRNRETCTQKLYTCTIS